MFRMALAIVLAIIAGSSASGTASARREIDSLIRYEVENNNRLFLDGESGRYVEDLHLYLRCAASVKANGGNGKKLEHLVQGEECAEYQLKAIRDSVEVPNLRTDATRAYRVRYDPVGLAYPADYATDGRRRVKFSLSDAWRRQNARAGNGCRWRFVEPTGRTELVSPDCAPVVREIELSPTDDGRRLHAPPDAP